MGEEEERWKAQAAERQAARRAPPVIDEAGRVVIRVSVNGEGFHIGSAPGTVKDVPAQLRKLADFIDEIKLWRAKPEGNA